MTDQTKPELIKTGSTAKPQIAPVKQPGSVRRLGPGQQQGQAKPVKSPCISICALNEADMCVGCYRTGHEISRWSRYSDDERREVLKLSVERSRKSNPFL